jgi:5-methyltetrahydropteroyltriglutamate--homocysteine methyltransferase
MTIPSPSVLHFRGGRRAVDAAVYPEMDGFFNDLRDAYAERWPISRGRLPLPPARRGEHRLSLRSRADRAAQGARRGNRGPARPLCRADQRRHRNRPADMVVSMHLCRGNFRSMHIASGGYDPVAEVLFNGIGVDAYFMEYDDERSGSFAPLRFVPKGKTVVLGLVTSKRGELESRDELLRRIEDAAKYLPIEQLAISPQCGFASTEEGNTLSVEEEWAKLRRCTEVAREVWGGTTSTEATAATGAIGTRSRPGS